MTFYDWVFDGDMALLDVLECGCPARSQRTIEQIESDFEDEKERGITD